MRKAFTYILIFFALSVSAQTEYKPKVAWKTIVDSVGYISPNTYIVKVDPIDYNDPGAIQRIVSGYLMDNIGHVYTVIDSTSTTITVTDDFGYGISPVAGKKGWVFQSVGDGTAPYIAPVMYEPLDSKAKDNADKLFKDILWREANLYAQDSAKIQFDADTLTWDATKYDLDTLSFLRSFTEIDPIFSAHTTSNITNGTGILKNDGAGNWSYESASSSSGIETVTQTSHGLNVGDWIKVNGGTYQKALANTPINADVIGVVNEVINSNQFKYQYSGVFTSGIWAKGENYFLSPSVAGTAETSPSFEHGEVQVFLGTGIDSGLLLEIDVGVTIDTTGVVELYTDVYNEIPTGIMNETNTNFTLSNTPISATVRIYLNGLRQTPIDDYSVLGATITFIEPPYSGDKILVDYKY